jgi:hypothetical protein
MASATRAVVSPRATVAHAGSPDPFLEDLRGDVGNQPGRCRTSALVGDDADFVAFGTDAQRGPQEVAAARGIDPGRARDEMLRSLAWIPAHRELAAPYTPGGAVGSSSR